MRSEDGKRLDLNNLPMEYGERRGEGREILEESSTTSTETTNASRLIKKKNGGKSEGEKIYKCRFCSLKFGKSQSLGGHMNRHRQERETETLNRARQLVYCNEGLAAQGHLTQLGCSAHTFAAENFHQGRAALHSKPLCSSLPSPIFSRAIPQTQYSPLQPAPYNIYQPSSPNVFNSFPTSHPHPGMDFYIGQAITGDSQYNQYHYIASDHTNCPNYMGALPSHGRLHGRYKQREMTIKMNGQSMDCSFSEDKVCYSAVTDTS